MCNDIAYALKYNARYIVGILELLLPYLMFNFGRVDWGVYEDAVHYGIPIVWLLVVYLLKGIADRANVGNTIPVPQQRFTSVDADGEVSIPTARTQELILYIADLEDYLERKGKL